MIYQQFRASRHSALTVTAVALSTLLAAASARESDEATSAASDLASGDIAGPFVAEALRQNASLATHEKRYQAARSSIPAAAALPNPNVQLTHFVESIQTRTGPQRQALMLQQPIPWLGKLDSKRDTAQARSESLWHAYASQQFKVVDQVAEQVFEIAFLDKSIAITERNALLLERLEDIVENRVRSGAELADLLRLQVETERVRDLAERQITQRSVATAKLDSLLGRAPRNEPLSLAWSAPQPLEADPGQWLRTVSDRSPEIAMLRSLESSEDARARLARLASRPDFSVGLNYIRTGDAMNATTPGSGTDPWAVMVGVSLPIWGKANNALELQASLERDAVSSQIEDTRLQLLAEAHGLIDKLEDAQQRIQRYDTTLLPLARQSQEITQTSYESGKASVLDLIESERALLKLETEYWRAAADAWSARWKLATLSGGLWLD